MEKTAEIYIKVARLQSEFWREILSELRKMLRNFPVFFGPLFCESKKVPQSSCQISTKMSVQKIERKTHRRASAGAQGEITLANADGENGQPTQRAQGMK